MQLEYMNSRSNCPDSPPGVPTSRRTGIARRNIPQKWRNDVIKVLHKKNDQTEGGMDRGNSLVAHAGEVVLKIVTPRIGIYCEPKDLQPEEQYAPPLVAQPWIWFSRCESYKDLDEKHACRCSCALSIFRRHVMPSAAPFLVTTDDSNCRPIP